MKKGKSKIIVTAAGLVLSMTVLCGVVYTGVITGIGNLFFGKQANGSIIKVDGVAYGSQLLAQEFMDQEHMWGRIMQVNATTFQNKDGEYLLYAGPTNLSPESEAFKEMVDERVSMIKESNPTMKDEKIPVDLVTSSGSGLDPSISLAAAEYQVDRIAEANNMSSDEVEEIIDKCKTKKVLGVFGEDTVNVLKVNLMLEGIL